ncbi:Hydrogenase-4 component A [hydrothermal vent metagenome]|uniref:Hydrogenase-4 component A n=1 Tax=hydrothermal vent metagenome TaxID=652676 RepID=A0A1W1ECZ6_9ZZZZ
MRTKGRINKFVIADPALCIGCATCMAACYESAHVRGKLAVPRLVVTRTKSGVMPNQCRQCDDAPCVKVCPVGALKFANNSVELTEEICIGCKMCIFACPFGAIRAEAETMPSVNYAMNLNSNLGLDSEVEAKSIAVKCDLCKGSEAGPACVIVCPTGALSFINEEKINNELIKGKAESSVESFIQSALNNS